MADENAHIGRTLDDIKAQIAAKLGEAARLLPTANLLAGMIGAPPVALSDFIGDHDDVGTPVVHSAPGADRSATNVSRTGSARHIKPDTFLGDPPLDAAKKYMGMVGHAVHIDEIASAVERGGAAAKGSDWRDKLELGLLRSTHDVVKVQDKTYGLVSFYTPAQIEGLRGSRRREKPKPKRSTRGRDKGAPKASKSASASKPKTEAKDAKKADAAPASPSPEATDATTAGQVH